MQRRGEVSAVVRARHELVREAKTGGNPRLGGRSPPLFMQALLDSDDPEEDGGATAFPKREAQHFVSVSRKSSFRRLHVNHACYVKPFKCQTSCILIR